MFDTVATSKSYLHPPNIKLIENNGGKPLFSRFTGELYKIVLNPEKDSKEPRITISRSPNSLWITKSEVSIPAWLNGSNLYLPDEKDISRFYEMHSEFVEIQTGRIFDTPNARVTRLDAKRDYPKTSNRVLSIIASLNQVIVPKYNRRPFNNTSVSFDNKGKKKNKRYIAYSKYHEVLARNGSLIELELAKGILSLEVQHKDNTAVANAAKSLKYPNHSASIMLTQETSEKLIEKAVSLLQLEAMLENENSAIENLFNAYNPETAYKLITHLYLKSQYGAEYSELPFITISKETIKRYEKMCAKAGCLSLE